MYYPHSTWTWTFFLIVVGQAVIGLALEGYVFGRFLMVFNGRSFNGGDQHGQQAANIRSIDTYLSLFIFGFLYQIALTWDALRLKNTIQVIGLCLYNVGLMIYAIVQTIQIQDAVDVLVEQQSINFSLWNALKPYMITVPCIIALATVLMSIVAWKLYDEFSWSIYKHISADLSLKRRYLVYQIYITLLKFDFFFFLSFTVQFLVVVLDVKDVEFKLTVAALPITIIILVMAGFWTRRESILGMLLTIILYFGALGYFFFKLVRMYDESTIADRARVSAYKPARRGLTTFAIITILLLVSTIINAVWCTINFDKGLKPHLQKRQVPDVDGKMYETNSTYHGGVPLGQVPPRMTID
ncbi:hypothetical protein K461DRAFT_292137 [Myriangium duriaei CBS 260.36]|uniref:Uncharacterized protein n=1 Tax=Myriangium duriaei CBS 260.36 TaxID=1168546 RepID=A0A9P4MMJ4_9PEZI|nr:hypothetical protein K461DRAFT_292137 [Myriangium duriaei CBS 260.36]